MLKHRLTLLSLLAASPVLLAETASVSTATLGQLSQSRNEASSKAAFNGIVVDKSGAVIPGVTILLHGSAAQDTSFATKSDSNGVFRLGALPAGQYKLLASGPGFKPTELQITVGGDDLPVRISLAVAGLSSSIEVRGREDDLIGIANSANQGTVGAAELQARPILRSGEVLETVPGLIVTQHAGGGKANQYFLRGFNLDHGTDFSISIDGMPLNLPSHAHGEGYADFNTVIPEFVERLNFEKGPYYADAGNYSSAGAARLEFFKALPHDFVQVEGGMRKYSSPIA